MQGLSTPINTSPTLVLTRSPRTEGTINLHEVDFYLRHGNIEAIVRDKKLFWSVYCKALLLYQKEENIHTSYNEYFCVDGEGSNIKYCGKANSIISLENSVERLRTIIQEGLEEDKAFEIFFVEKGRQCYLLKDHPSLESTSKGLDLGYYIQFINPALPKLFELCGASLEIKKRNPPSSISCVDSVVREISQITWQKRKSIYPITPKPIPESKEMSQALYEQYQRQKCCDLTLIAADHTAYKVHAAVLAINGGDLFEWLLSECDPSSLNEKEIQLLSNTHLSVSRTETTVKTIFFLRYDGSAVKGFIEYAYLGGKNFLNKYSENSNAFDLSQLYGLANRYKIPTLVDCTTNLISLGVTKEDLSIVEDLLSRNDNAHLRKLHQYLTNEIKKD